MCGVGCVVGIVIFVVLVVGIVKYLRDGEAETLRLILEQDELQKHSPEDERY